MTFTNYVKSKQSFLIFYFLLHGFALFVNIFDIEGDMSKPLAATVKGELNDYTKFHLFTTTSNFSGNDKDKKPSSQFWPIVPFRKSNRSYNPDNNTRFDFSKFNGIFFQYDASEFLAYSFLILLVLYLRWSSKQQAKK